MSFPVSDVVIVFVSGAVSFAADIVRVECAVSGGWNMDGDKPVVKAHKRKGVHVSFWISDEQAEKLDELAMSSGLTRSKIWKALLDRKMIPERSFARLCGEIAKIGGLIKGKVVSGKHGDAYRLGQELVKIARALKKDQEKWLSQR